MGFGPDTSPYFDDYFSTDGGLDKNYYKVLFKPGKALQARELTTAQSILQNQLGSFGRTYFPDGGSVYGSQKNLDNPLNYAVLDSVLTSGASLEKNAIGDGYLNFSVGDLIIGGISNTKAVIDFVMPSESVSDPNMIFIKYLSSGETSNTEMATSDGFNKSNCNDATPLDGLGMITTCCTCSWLSNPKTGSKFKRT